VGEDKENAGSALNPFSPSGGSDSRQRAVLGLPWLAVSLLASAVAHAAPRVVSLDQCADQYVLALSPRGEIAGLSPRALADDSFLRDRGKGLPIVRADSEAILGARPTVVVRYWGGAPSLLADLKRRGVAVVAIDDETGFAGVRANIRRVARALDEIAPGERLIAAMDAKLSSSAGAWRGQRAVYLTSGGDTSGKDTLIDAMFAAAGLNNATRTVGYSELSLESLVARPPAAIVGGFFDRSAIARQPWGIGRHRVLRDLMRRKALVSLPGSILGCPAWFAADGVAAIAAAAPGRRPTPLS
jgi:iron complex transport system substrate-binding protein